MSIEQRIERLERRNRQLVVVLGVIVGVGVLAVFVSCEAATDSAGVKALKELHLERLVIVDHMARPRIELSAWATADQAFLWMYDTKGIQRASLSVNEYSPVLSMSDADGKTRVMFGAFSDGPRQVFLDSTGNHVWAAP